ncbi:S8 family serine peptidase [Peribacillus glennii]|uniref:Peptidase S8 n=1 Tax=Peribacillus glennii TaxID=2303991 RepID=A0A372L9D8_9BACI|nr:S8 family serine peptidase [Peribacillus glennii]RFU61149.1 peptidase S8 [Peribacillus glennii]
MKRFAKKAAMLAVCTGLLLPGIPINEAKAISNTGSAFSTEQNSSIQNGHLFGLMDKPSANEQKPAYSEDQILIKYKKPLSPKEHKLAGGTIIKKLPGLPYVIVKVKNKKAQEKALKTYSKNAKVALASPSALFQKLGYTDPKADKQYHQSMLNISKAQALAGNKKVKVAVIDGGIDQKHPEMKSKVISSYNVLNPINPGLPDEHGTHVGGIIAAEKNNGIGGYGVNPNAEILSIDVFGRSNFTNDYTIAQAIYEAIEKGAKVINMSLGSLGATPILEEAVQKAISKGITIVAAAGNEAMDIPSYPASYEGVISVGSVNNQKKLSYYSSFGPTVDIAAPGENIYSTVYDMEKKSTFESMSGTSMASPVVAGVASLLLAKHPGLTPVQVEYILETTANDLGASGYDTKFGNGLVNPVAALSYDIKKIPAFVKEAWTDKEILAKATAVETSEPVEINESFTKPFEQHWIKFNVKEGEYIQSALNSAGEYDHKLMIHFYSENEKQQTDINSVRNGGTEGKLVKAPFDGTIAIGVKDVNGSFDSSKGQKDTYSLQVMKQEALPEDTSTVENMQDISEVPYSNNEHTFASGEKVDNDYFTFTPEEAKLYQLNVSGVPGVDSTVSVYREDQIVPPQEEGQPPLSEEEKRAIIKEALESSKAPAEAVSNKGRVSDGESLFFKAEPAVKYIVKVSNKPEYQNEMNVFSDLLLMIFGSQISETESAILPYTLSVDSKTIPADEDVFSREGIAGNEENGGDSTEEEYYKQLEEMINFYQENARPYPLGSKADGYLQGLEDLDLFKFTPEKTGIYKFEIPKSNGQGFTLEIAQLTSEKLDDGRTVPAIQTVGANVNWSGWGALTESFHTVLKQGETYFMAVSPNIFENDFSLQQYQIHSNFVMDDQSDKYEDNDIFKHQSKPITDGGTITGNFAAPNDLDAFYFKPEKSGLYTTLMERGKPDSKLISKLPPELFAPVYGSIVAIEDVNNNKKYDEADYESFTIFENGIQSGSTYGSFKAVKGKGYFLVLQGLIEDGQFLSLNPYHFTVAAARSTDEDSRSAVKNNKPSKPIGLKKVNSITQRATGYLNGGIPFGDEDWYTFTLKKDAKLRIDLSSGNEADMVIALYQNGKLLNKADYYKQGDTETLFKSFKKGTYHIKVRDAYGNATIKPYQLTVTNK